MNLLFLSKTDMLLLKGKAWGFWDGTKYAKKH